MPANLTSTENVPKFSSCASRGRNCNVLPNVHKLTSITTTADKQTSKMLQHSLQGFSTALDCRRTHRRAQGLHRCPQAPRVVQTCVISAGRRRSRPALDVLDQHSVLGDTADHAVFDRAQNGSAPEPLKALIDRILNEEFQALGPLVLPSTDSDDESAEPRWVGFNVPSLSEGVGDLCLSLYLCPKAQATRLCLRCVLSRHTEHASSANGPSGQLCRVPGTPASLRRYLTASCLRLHASTAFCPRVHACRQQRSNTSSSEDTEDSKDTETCVVAHPGSLCCSTTTISRQPSSKSVVIELKTTVK